MAFATLGGATRLVIIGRVLKIQQLETKFQCTSFQTNEFSDFEATICHLLSQNSKDFSLFLPEFCLYHVIFIKKLFLKIQLQVPL